MTRALLALVFLGACHSDTLTVSPDPTGTAQQGADAGCVAPADTLQPCGGDAVCAVDADCDHLAGTYCGGPCAWMGCVRHGCVLTHVQGEPCDRDAACWSGVCHAGACAP